MVLRLKRFGMSVFLIGHVAAVVLTNLPDCPMRRTLGYLWVDGYLMPTGLWQSWGMFAPEPAKDTLTLEAIVRDSRGLIRQLCLSSHDGPIGVDRLRGRLSSLEVRGERRSDRRRCQPRVCRSACCPRAQARS